MSHSASVSATDRGAIYSRALARAAGAAMQWRLLLLWSAALLAPTAVLALPLWRILGGALDHSVHAPALAQRLDALHAFDLLDVIGRDGVAVTTAGLLSLAITLLLSPLMTGMAISAARSGERKRFGALIAGGVRQYGRMARMLMWSCVPLGAALALGAVVVKVAAQHNEAAITEEAARMASMAALAIALLLFAIAQASVDCGRAMMALAPLRRSAIEAWWAGLSLLGRYPLACMGIWLSVSAVALALAALIAVWRIQLPPLSGAGMLSGFLLTQAAALAIAWSRSGRLFALIALAEASGLAAPVRVAGAVGVLTPAAAASAAPPRPTMPDSAR